MNVEERWKRDRLQADTTTEMPVPQQSVFFFMIGFCTKSCCVYFKARKTAVVVYISLYSIMWHSAMILKFATLTT